MSLLLKPVDTFFFRDHQDFHGGENPHASALFPPRPGTVYGALRSAFIYTKSDFSTFVEGRDESLKRRMGTPHERGNFSIQGIFLYDGKTFLFPLPLDYLVVKGERKASPLILRRGEGEEDHYELVSTREEKTTGGEGYYLTMESLRTAMLVGGEIDVTPLSRLLVKEEKVGIAHDWQTNRHLDKMFYQIEMLRFKDKAAGIVAFTEDDGDFQDVPYARLGGRNRPWRIFPIQQPIFYTEEEKKKLIEQIHQTGLAKLLLLTPAIWEKGNRPRDCSKDGRLTLPGRNGREVKIVKAIIGRPLLIGGWDMVRQGPKSRYQAVPAGSLLYVKVDKKDAEDFVRETYLASLSDQLTHEGYGLLLPGAVLNG